MVASYSPYHVKWTGYTEKWIWISCFCIFTLKRTSKYHCWYQTIPFLVSNKVHTELLEGCHHGIFHSELLEGCYHGIFHFMKIIFNYHILSFAKHPHRGHKIIHILMTMYTFIFRHLQPVHLTGTQCIMKVFSCTIWMVGRGGIVCWNSSSLIYKLQLQPMVNEGDIFTQARNIKSPWNYGKIAAQSNSIVYLIYWASWVTHT